MIAPLLAAFQGKTPSQILDELAVQIYKPPLSTLRDQLPDLPAAIRVPMLVIDFDTELNMQGILGFLENSTGLYLNETIEALEMIEARQTAEIMKRIRTIMARFGVSTADLRADFQGTDLYQITSFQQLHGPDLTPMADEVAAEADKLYLYVDKGEDVFSLLTDFITSNVAALLDAIRICAKEKGSETDGK